LSKALFHGRASRALGPERNVEQLRRLWKGRVRRKSMIPKSRRLFG
jgi:hypothetical protein